MEATTAQGSQSKGLALAALVVGIVAFLTGLIPWLGLLAAVAAIGLGVLALVKRQSKPLSVTGTALGGVALLTGLVVTVAFTSVLTSPNRQAPVAEERAEVSATPTPQEAEPTPTPTPPAVEPSPAQEESSAPAAPAADGSVERPLPQPYVAKGLLGGEKYSLTAQIVNANAGEAVREWNQFNDEAPAGYKYVVIELTMTGIDVDGVEPSLAEYDMSLATGEGNRYDSEYVFLGDDMPRMSDGPTLYPGNSFTGFLAYIVPESAQSFLLHDNGRYVSF
ncbi:DUF4190 domain-containing protein [Microbacterium sp. lyk4-40-TSB-66]|uniref:DUF4190 domain-containing protein n=1 Tax=Microbacterium sp. lyk4-40-TSB-66 TaxID=3040294 RepID=UPI00254B1831|nr:DUF4190 domain-containing protein [Microbacterium sp. lyk4-40-TSB-66]